MVTSSLPAASTPGIGLVKFGLFAEDSEDVMTVFIRLLHLLFENRCWQ